MPMMRVKSLRVVWCAVVLAAMALSPWCAGQSSPPPAPSEPAPAPEKHEPVAPPPAAAPAPVEAPADDEPAQRPTTRREEPPKPGDLVMVIQRNGDRMQGELVEADDLQIVLRISNVRVELNRSEIDTYFKISTPAERYKQRRAMIRDDDFPHLIALAQWGRDQGLYDEALVDVATVLRSDPSNADGLRLRTELTKLNELRERRGVSTEGHGASGGDAHSALPKRPAIDEFPVLTPEQINLIKVYEVNLADPPRITVTPETIDKFFKRYAESGFVPKGKDDREAFKRLSGAEILKQLFLAKARDLYPEVKVLDQPATMKAFRDNVHASWLVNNCATTRCHGGLSGGRLLLLNRKPNAEQTYYTNYLILDRFRTRDDRPLIDWVEPERSLLIQMGLPRDDAVVAHPDAKGWTPVFRSRDDKRLLQTVEWIKSMYRPHPEYPVKYDPPRIKETEAPSKPGAAGGDKPVER